LCSLPYTTLFRSSAELRRLPLMRCQRLILPLRHLLESHRAVNEVLGRAAEEHAGATRRAALISLRRDARDVSACLLRPLTLLRFVLADALELARRLPVLSLSRVVILAEVLNLRGEPPNPRSRRIRMRHAREHQNG